MQFVATKANRRVKQSFRAFASLVLLLSYMIGSAQFESFHKLFHEHESVSNHSPDQEKDPCHRSIYHGDNEDGCQHKSHVSKVDRCDLCHLAFHSDQVCLADSNLEFFNPEASQILSVISFPFYSALALLPSRAPPFC